VTAPYRREQYLTALRRFGPYLVAALVAAGAIMGLMWRPPTVNTAHRADYVVIAGAAGLRWDDVNPTDTPTLWAMVQRDSVGALSVRSAHTPTCPADGWLTLGAGNYARRGSASVDTACPVMQPQLTSPDGIGAAIRPAEQNRIIIDNRSLPYGTQPGALAEAVRCTVAVGTGAAIAATRPFGRIDRYAATPPANLGALLGACTLSMVDLGTVSAADPNARRAQARTVDATLAKVVAARPPNSLLLVAGLADTDTTARLHVAIADGPGYGPGWLTSAGTGRPGYMRLVDFAPTALAALGQPDPVKLFIGDPVQTVAGRSADPAVAVSRLADADHEAAVQRHVAGGFFWVFIAFETVLLIAAVPLLRRARRSVEPHGSSVSPRVVRAVEAFLVIAAVTLVAALLADVVPWWRNGSPGITFAALCAGFAVAAMAAIMLGPPWRGVFGKWREQIQTRHGALRIWRRGALGPIAAAAAVCAGVVAIDVLTGSHLQLNGVAGYSATSGTRSAGIGAVGLGAFIVGVLMLAGCVAQRVPSRTWRPAVVAAIVALGVIVVGSPYLGADPGGAVALTAGGCMAAAIASGGWLSFVRLTWATLAGLAVLIGFAVLDLRRPVAERGQVGQFLTQLHAGTAGEAIHRTVVSDVLSSATSPLTALVMIAILFNLAVLIRPWGGLMRLFGLYPAVRGALTGIAIAALFAGLLDGDGFVTAGAAAGVTLPLVTVAAMRVLDHADDRTASDAVLAAAPAPVSPTAEQVPTDIGT
jgi:hypothetical protein